MNSDWEKVRLICARVMRQPPDLLRPETRLIEDLHASSLDLTDMAMFMEEEFKIALSDESLQKAITLAELVQLATTSATSRN